MPTWSIALPAKFSVETLSQWVDEQLACGVPRGVISHHLLSDTSEKMSYEEFETSLRVEQELSSVMVNRNLKGIELEKAGRTQEAVLLYEANVADWCGGNHPYHRLQVIYTKQGRLSDAIRVCDAFVAVADELIALGPEGPGLLAKRREFSRWAEKLRAKQP